MTDEEPVVKSVLKTNRKRLKKKRKVSVKKENCEEDEVIVDPDELKYLRYSIDERYSAPRQLFLKRDRSNEFSLIVANVPAYLPKVRLYLIFNGEGWLNVIFEGQLTLSVLFKEPRGVSSALAKCQAVGPYRVCDFCKVEMPSVLQSNRDFKFFFQAVYDNFFFKAKRLAKRKFTEPDEDGWITVTKAAKKVCFYLKTFAELSFIFFFIIVPFQVDLAFYSFDKKNAREKKLNELREKFMQDKKRVALLKNARKFKPG
uniref:RRP7 domain-containing protein n=1 Tax=Angiostrongylus cantonensis TaxID=6313 RepID=A0A0K0DAF5_ANGCA